jgi:hypothetical protein
MTTARQVFTTTTNLAGPVAAATFVAGVAGAAALSDAPYPRPGSSAEQIKNYFIENAGPARVSIAGQLISAAAMGVFSAGVARLARRVGKRSQATSIAAIAGGLLSAATLTASALYSLALTRGAAKKPESALALHRRAFLAGGPLHGPAIGLLAGALGLAGLRTRELPRSLSYACLATAAAGLLAPIALRAKPAVFLVPASRFPGLLLSAIAGVWLNRR